MYLFVFRGGRALISIFRLRELRAPVSFALGHETPKPAWPPLLQTGRVQQAHRASTGQAGYWGVVSPLKGETAYPSTSAIPAIDRAT